LAENELRIIAKEQRVCKKYLLKNTISPDRISMAKKTKQKL
jgi:hypothetical protein